MGEMVKYRTEVVFEIQQLNVLNHTKPAREVQVFTF